MCLAMHCSRRWLQISFKYREAQQTKVDAKVADTENGAYPV